MTIPRIRIKPAQIGRAFQLRGGHECGAFAGNMAIVVVDKHPQQKPGLRPDPWSARLLFER